MKKLIILLPMAALIIAGSTAVAQDGAATESRPSRQEIVKKYDQNGDGKLDDSERNAARVDFEKSRGRAPSAEGSSADQQTRDGGASRADMVKKYDKDGDGKLDEAERNTMREDITKNRGNAPGGRGPTREAMMKEFDTDGDGKLSDTERQVAMTEMRKRYQEQGVPGRAGGPNGRPQFNREELLKKHDKNGDGKLDDQERTAAREDVEKNTERRRPRPEPKSAATAPEPEAKKN